MLGCLVSALLRIVEVLLLDLEWVLLERQVHGLELSEHLIL